MSESRLPYPNARRDDVVDDFHGTPVADPYRWMEDPATPESREWTDAQNQLTRQWIDGPVREQVRSRLEKLCNYSRWSTPFKRGNRYFFEHSEGLQNQPILYWQRRFTDEPRPLLNPNAISQSGIVSVASADPSRDGEWLAYSLSQRGSDWQEVRIRNVETGEDLPEIIHHTKFAGVAWHPNNTGFFYNRYPDPETVADAALSYYNKVYWHSLNTDQVDDVLVYERPDHKDLGFWPQTSEDGVYLLITAYLGTDRRNGVYYRRLDSNGPFATLLDTGTASYRFLGNDGERFYFFTDHAAPRGRVVAIDLQQPQPEHWQEIIPEAEDALTQVIIAGNELVCVYLHHAHHQVKLYHLDGHFDRELLLPTLGSVSELHGKRHDDELLLGFSSFLYPACSYLYNLRSHTLVKRFASELDFDTGAYTTRQVFAPSPDGTQVPIFLVHRADLTPSAETPLLMYGYGGFRHALSPSFSATLLPWLEQGGIYALVNTRGGSEYGTEWYQAGTLERKQNVFDDFMAAGDYLVQQGLTSPAKLAIRGGSNGGLLVGACMLQRPDLLGAVVCQVPVLDMLRYHRFTIGRYWVSDYGNAEANAEDFRYMYAYSPLHNVKPDTAYPPVLITSADHDDRVVPSHAKKFAATLQYTNPDNLTLLRIDTDAGHGRGKPLGKVMDEMADIYAFLARSLDFVWR